MNEMSEKIVNTVLYHDNCLDGFAAAWCFWYMQSKDNVFIPVQYGQQLPEPEKLLGNIYLVDFCYPPEQMVELGYLAHGRGIKVIVLDHHKTAIEALSSITWPVELEYTFQWMLDSEHSGAWLAWNYLCIKKREAKLAAQYSKAYLGIRHIQDRDLWKFRLANTKEYCAYMHILPRNFKVWEPYIVTELGVDRAIAGGEILLAARDVDLETLKAQAYPSTIVYETENARYVIDVLEVNVPAMYTYDLGNILAKDSPSGIAVLWQQINEGTRQYSLRGVDSTDVSKIAKYYGGGGHKNAAGFRLDRGEW